jgi:hypothetical protein
METALVPMQLDDCCIHTFNIRDSKRLFIGGGNQFYKATSNTEGNVSEN